jgi:RNA polymerase sigma-70 factor (ECF subfamily)
MRMEPKMTQSLSPHSSQERAAWSGIRCSRLNVANRNKGSVTTQALVQEIAMLVAAVADRHDEEAFTQLFDHFAPRLNAYLRRLGADSASAEEITQETMVILWRKAALFDPQKSSLATWLYRIARNRCFDHLRRNRLDFLDVSDPFFELVDEVDLVTQVDMQWREKAVRSALEDLPKEQLSLVRLAFFDGLSHSQISERIGLPLGTVKSRIRLGFARLRRSLEAGGIAEAD